MATAEPLPGFTVWTWLPSSFVACLRKNPQAKVYLFNKAVLPVNIDPKQTVMANAELIASIADGGTACSAPLKLINDEERLGDLVVIASDNQSWVESMNIDRYGRRRPGKTELQAEWERWKMRNPQAKMVCVDVAPYTTTQAQERHDILNIGGFSDTVFELTDSFALVT